MKKQETRRSKPNSLHATQFPTMKNWDNPDHRIKAAEKFVADLNAMTTTQVEDFVNSSAKTKTKFAECGPFYVQGKTNPAYAPWSPQSKIKQIPKATKFRVFRNGNMADFLKRNKQVILIVNPDGNKDEPLGAAQMWRCTYSPYVGQPVEPKAKARPRSK